MARFHLFLVSSMFLLLLLPLALASEVEDVRLNVEPKLYAGWRVFEVEVEKDELDMILENLEKRDDLSIWKVIRNLDGSWKMVVMMAPSVKPYEAFAFEWGVIRRTLQWKVVIDDLGPLVKESYVQNSVRQEVTKMDWTQFHGLDVIDDFVVNTVTERRRTITVKIGTSIQGRPIYAVVVGTKARQVANAITRYIERLYASQNVTEGEGQAPEEEFDATTTLSPSTEEMFESGDSQVTETTTEAGTTMNPGEGGANSRWKRSGTKTDLGNVMILEAGTHSREWISPALATYVIDQLSMEKKKFHNLATWVVIPMANPDGYEFSRTRDRFWRKNLRVHPSSSGEYCFGVDLNRNYGEGFGGSGTSNNTCSQIYRGPEAFSEPESRAIRDLIDALKDYTKFFITAHSFGNMLLYPWGGSKEPSVHEQKLNETAMALAEDIKKQNSTQYRVGQVSRVIYVAAGGSLDYAHAQGVELSFVIELPGRNRGFLLSSSEIIPVSKETYCGLRCTTYRVAGITTEASDCLEGCGH